MATTKVTSRDFNQHPSRAKKTAKGGPVVITERGKPAHVLLTYEDYQNLTGAKKSVVDLLSQPPGVEDIELDIPTRRDLARAADLD